jgi:hypothetical protein
VAELADLDVIEDLAAVRQACPPDGRFRRATESVEA